jgi:filamentous hemagglutinin family protein
MPPEMDARLPSYGPSLRPSAPARAKASADASEGIPGPAAVIRRALHAVIPSALALLVIATGTSTRADESIKADTTLKSNNTVVTPSTADGKTTYTITGGAERNSGRYLFHSFAAFNLLKNEIGHFNNLDSVNTIFSRVTGLSQSNIDGLIRANGAANLYLINPKGIVFGPNARIDVGGAFKASTAEALLFKSEKFSAIDPQDAPVLTSDIVPGLQFGSTPATLNNAGVLVVKEGQEILLAGGPDHTVISSGTITANGGAITLEGGNITVSGGGIQANNGGSINLSAGQSLSVSGPVAIITETKGSGKGGDINLKGSTITIEKGAIITTQATITTEDIFSKDSSGNILKDSSGNPIIKIAANKGVTGDAGDIRLLANNVSLKDKSIITTETQTTGKGGLISVDSNNLNLSGGSQLTTAATPTSTSRGGDINLNASTPRDLTISISGDGSIIDTKTKSKAVGDLGKGGDIKVGTTNQTLTIKGENTDPIATTRITTQTNGVGNGGQISLLGSNITITDKAKVTTETIAAGNGGLLSVDAGALNLAAGSQLFSTTTGAGNGGSFSLNASTPRDLAIAFSGNSLISSTTEQFAAGGGQGGSILLGTTGNSLSIAGAGFITAASSGSGNAGAVELRGTSVSLDQGSKATSASSASGSGGSITVDAGSLNLSGGSQLTTAATATSTNKGGDINLNASTPRDLTISISGDGSIIDTKTKSKAVGDLGKGGDIKVGTTNQTLTIKGENTDPIATTRITTQTNGVGNGGQISLLGSNITITDKAKVTTETTAAGNGGSISLSTKSLQLGANTQITSSASGTGAGGAITVAPAAVVPLQIKGPGLIETQPASSGVAGAIRIGSTTASDLSLSDGVRLQTSRSSVDLASTGTTSLQGGSISAAGSTVAIKGDTRVSIQGTEISALNPTIGQPPLGSITITGGSIKVGRDTGRTLLRAGEAQNLSKEEENASNLTLLDGGTGDTPAIKLQGGANQAIEIFSVAAPLDPNQGITTLRGANEAITSGGSINITGGTGVSIANANLYAPTAKVGDISSQGSITITGGSIKVGRDTGRTLLRAGDAQNLSAEEHAATNFTLLDSAVTLTAGANQSIEVFSGTAAVPGTTTLRTKLTDNTNPDDPNSIRLSVLDNGQFKSGLIVVGGVLNSNPIPPTLTTSSTTTLSTGTFLKSQDIYVVSSGLLNDQSKKEGSTKNIASQFDLNYSHLENTTTSLDNTYFYEATGSGPGSGYIKLTFDANQKLSLDLNSEGEVAKMYFKARNNIEFQNVYISISSDSKNTAGAFKLESTKGSISLNNTKLNALGNNGSIVFSAGSSGICEKNIELLNSELNTSITNGVAAGSIELEANNVDINNSKIISSTTGSGSGGIVKVDADSLNLSGGSQLTTEATNTSTSKAGNINLNASTPRELTISFTGKDAKGNFSKINAQTASQGIGDDGKGGDIKIGTANQKLTIKGDKEDSTSTTRITAQTYGVGNGGSISLFGSDIKISDKVKVTAETMGSGNGGSISLDASDSINLRNEAKINAQATKTTVDTTLTDGSGKIYKIPANNGKTGDAGRISLSANAISLIGKSIITAETQTYGEGGLILLYSDKLNLFGGSQLTTAATKTSNSMAGNIYLNNPTDNNIIKTFTPRDLIISFSGDGSIINAQTASQGKGEAGKGGDIKIGTANKLLTISGAGIITAQTNSSGDGGNVSLFGTDINISNKAKVTAKTTNAGIGGTVNVDAKSLNLSGDSQLTTEATNTSTSKAGNIYLNNPTDNNINTFTPRDLTISFSGDGSIINAQTASQGKGEAGKGGDIKIGTANQFLTISGAGIITAQTNSSGEGGNVSLFGTDINISNKAKVTAETTNAGIGGTVNVDAKSLNLSGGSQLTTEAKYTSTSKAGDINLNNDRISARDLTISFSGKDSDGNYSKINAQTVSTGSGEQGRGGNINIGISNQKLTINGDTTDQISTTRITAQTNGVGNGGSISLFGSNINIKDNAKVTAQTNSAGSGGTVNVDAGALKLSDGSQLTTEATKDSSSFAGNINLNTSTPRDLSISFSGDSSIINAETKSKAVGDLGKGGNITIGTSNQSLSISGDTNNKISTTRITAQTNGVGNGGNITLFGSNINITDKAKVTAETTNAGNGGTVNVDAKSLNLSGGSQLTTEATQDSSSIAGNINLNASTPRDLSISFLGDGSIINAETKSKAVGDLGKGGNITIGTANQSLSISGDTNNKISTTRITAQTNGVGNGGSITLFGSNIYITDKAKVTAETTNAGNGGTVNVDAKSLNLSGGSQLTTEAFSTGRAGSIDLNGSTPRDLEIYLSDTSLINAKTAGSGNGGTINLGTFDKSLTIFGRGYITAETNDFGEGGSINLKGSSLNLKNGAEVSAKTTASGKGGLITVDAASITLSDGSQLSTKATSTGKAGAINLNSSTPRDLAITFSGNSLINAATELTAAGGGQGGTIQLGTSAKNLSIFGQGFITAETKGSGNGGDITLEGRAINVDAAQLTAQTSGTGAGGIVRATANSLGLNNKAKLSTQTSSTGNGGEISLFANTISLNRGAIATAETTGTGRGGTITVDADGLNLYGDGSSGGSQLSTKATSTGNAGAINLNSSTPRDLAIAFSGNSLINAATEQTAAGGGQGGTIQLGTSAKTLSIFGQGFITAETKGSGNGGNITLQGRAINVDAAKVTAQTSGSGNGGYIQATANSLGLDNKAKLSTQTSSTGKGGEISLLANTISLNRGAIATAETSGSGLGGTINVDADALNLYSDGSSGGSQLSTKATSTGNAGSISLNASAGRDLAIAFSGNSLINAATELTAPGGGQGGTIKLGTSAKTLSIFGQGSITAETKGSGNGGDITLQGRTINVDAAQLTAQTSGTGAGGYIKATANGLGLDNKAKLSTQTSSTGKGGEISLLANTISLNRGAIATAETSGSGLGGTINVDADALNLYSDGSSGGSQLSTKATSTGNAGSIFLNASTGRDLAIAFSGNSLINAATELTAPGGGQGGTIKLGTSATNLFIFGQGFITAETKGSGKGGGIDLNGSSISFDRGVVATAQTSGSGRGGKISVEANTITLDNRAKVSTRSSSGSDAYPQPTGSAGSIRITAAGPNSLHLRNGSQITSDTSSTIAWANDKDLANIIINTPNLTLDGASSISASTSAAAKAGAINLISAFTELGGGSRIATASTGSGAGGNININGTRLLLHGASQFKADGGNFGQAGSINISLRDRLQLDNQSSINASTARSASKQGGANISITLGGGLVLNNGSSITATASGKANGGNIKLLLPNGFLLSSFPAAFAGNDILASADAGDGGRIELRALGIFGMNINTFFTPISEASAKSRSGRDGVLALYIPFLTPDRGVVPIEQPLDPDNDLVRACSPRGDGRRAEFTQTGRGGQPSLPGDRPTAAPLLDDLGRPAPRRGLQTSASLSSTSQPAPAAAIPVASAIQLQGYAPRLALPLPPCPEPR